jgi:hypothetical protein
MGKIVVKLAGQELFVWSGERRDIRDLDRRVTRAAKSVAKTVPELTSLTMQSAFSAKALSADPAIRDMQVGGIAHYLLEMRTGRTDKPGKHGDYVATGSDFEFNLRPGQTGEVSIDVTGPPDF